MEKENQCREKVFFITSHNTEEIDMRIELSSITESIAIAEKFSLLSVILLPRCLILIGHFISAGRVVGEWTSCRAAGISN